MVRTLRGAAEIGVIAAADGLSRSVTSNRCFGSYLLQIEMFDDGVGECLDL